MCGCIVTRLGMRFLNATLQTGEDAEVRVGVVVDTLPNLNDAVRVGETRRGGFPKAVREDDGRDRVREGVFLRKGIGVLHNHRVGVGKN